MSNSDLGSVLDSHANPLMVPAPTGALNFRQFMMGLLVIEISLTIHSRAPIAAQRSAARFPIQLMDSAFSELFH
jgi:hypothetical protein